MVQTDVAEAVSAPLGAAVMLVVVVIAQGQMQVRTNHDPAGTNSLLAGLDAKCGSGGPA